MSDDQNHPLRENCSEILDVQVECDNLPDRLNGLEGNADDNIPREVMRSSREDPVLGAPGSRMQQTLMRVNSVSETIHLLKVTVDAKEEHLHDVLKQLEEKDFCISARDAIIDQRDTTIKSLLESLKEERAIVNSFHEQLVANVGQLKKKTDKIMSLRATLEENVAHRVSREHEIEALRGELETLKQEQIKEEDEVIRRREGVIRANVEKTMMRGRLLADNFLDALAPGFSDSWQSFTITSTR